MSKITNGGLTRAGCHRMLYSCTHMAIVGVKGLMQDSDSSSQMITSYILHPHSFIIYERNAANCIAKNLEIRMRTWSIIIQYHAVLFSENLFLPDSDKISVNMSFQPNANAVLQKHIVANPRPIAYLS